MKEITFATGNSGKVTSLEGHLASHGVEIAVVKRPLELIEPQANTASEVAQVKAQQAYEQLQAPVLVDDSSFHIMALGGFPGPYIKYMLETVGIEGIIAFMQGKSDRRAYFMSTLVFVDENGVPHVFEGRDPMGEIVEEIDEHNHPNAWSDLWKIFAPPGYGGKTYSQLTEAEFDTHRKSKDDSDNSAYARFSQWLKEEHVKA